MLYVGVLALIAALGAFFVMDDEVHDNPRHPAIVRPKDGPSQPIPEPSSVIMLGVGSVIVGVAVWKAKK